MRKIIFPIIVALSLLSKTAMADSEASAWLRSKQSQIISKQGLDSILDYQKIAEDSMGTHWGEASTSQKEDVKRLLSVIIKSSISKRLVKSKQTEIKWVGDEVKENLTVVKSTFSQKKKTSEDPLEVDFVIQKSGDDFKVIDLLFEGVSTVKTYRRQFDKTIKSSGIDGLISKLNEKAVATSIPEGDGC